MTEYKYSEIFYSMQGEGKYIGVPTAWLRFFSCNLQCNGFGQKNPTDPDTYILPYKDIDVSQYKTLEELPVFKYGCDSSYSWASKFKDLQRSGTAVEIADRIREVLPDHSWNTKYNDCIHMCFTGGEPLLPTAQKCITELLQYWYKSATGPQNITFETNGTQPITRALADELAQWQELRGEVFFSVSPKLYWVSGEDPDQAQKVNVIAQYALLNYFNFAPSTEGQIKFVVDGSQEAWDELEEFVVKLRRNDVRWPIWIMPVGATLEAQTGELDNYMSAGEIANEALQRGYNISPRTHVDLWGNLIGV